MIQTNPLKILSKQLGAVDDGASAASHLASIFFTFVLLSGSFLGARLRRSLTASALKPLSRFECPCSGNA